MSIRLRKLLVLTLVVTVLVPVAGCAADAPKTSPSTSAVAPSASETPVSDPELDPLGTAGDNLAYFDFVNAGLVEENPGGETIINSLVAAGFDKAMMQVTPDSTPLGSPVDSLQFSVQFVDSCLIGQAGGGYSSVVAPALASGGCLIGKTRSIDW